MRTLLAFAAGIAAGVYLGLRLVYDREPATFDEADDMCPNCVTPWKCNGPHLDTWAFSDPATSSAWREYERVDSV